MCISEKHLKPLQIQCDNVLLSPFLAKYKQKIETQRLAKFESAGSRQITELGQ